MNVTLKPFDFAQAAARAGMPQVADRVREKTLTEGVQDSFARTLRSVSETQNKAFALQREVQLGNPGVGLEETMVAMQKAQLGFQATLTGRNRLVQAYTDIMNMQV